MNNTNKLVAIICGIPFSGTTLLSRIITSHPLIESGFECGLLFGDSPKMFKEVAPKFYKWMMLHEPPYNWKLTPTEMEDVCNTNHFHKAYNKIVDYCHLFKGDKQFIVDKTPAYIYQLPKMIEKITDVPIIVVQKELFFQYHSYKKRGISLEEFSNKWVKSQKALNKTLKKKENRQRILIMDFQELNQYSGKSFRKIINHIHKFNPTIEFKKEYIPLLNQTLQRDIQSKQKKLRPKFDFQKEKDAFRNDITSFEEETLKNLTPN